MQRLGDEEDLGDVDHHQGQQENNEGDHERSQDSVAEENAHPRAQVAFSLGESVKVTSGPLSDFDGEIVDVNPDQQKLKVLVDIFERQVPVELGFDQVKKLD